MSRWISLVPLMGVTAALALMASAAAAQGTAGPVEQGSVASAARPAASVPSVTQSVPAESVPAPGLGQSTPTAAGPGSSTSPAGAFDRLSPGNEKIARALWEAQQPTSAGRPLTLDQIAAMKLSGQGWGQVFHEMKGRGLVQEKTLGQIVSGARRGDAAHRAVRSDDAAGARLDRGGAAAGGESMPGRSAVAKEGPVTAAGASRGAAAHAPRAGGRGSATAITTGSGRTWTAGSAGRVAAGSSGRSAWKGETAEQGARAGSLDSGGGRAGAAGGERGGGQGWGRGGAPGRDK